MLKLMDSGEASEKLHQFYVFLGGTKCEASDLRLSLHDMRRGMRYTATLDEDARERAAHPSGFGVPLLRVAQFIRQAGLLPKLVSRMITQEHDEVMEEMKLVPVPEQTPWWWSGTNERRKTYLPPRLGAFRYAPQAIDTLSRPVSMAFSNEFDVMGLTVVPTSRKAFHDLLSSDMEVKVQQRKRDRFVAYTLVHLLGHWLFPMQDPNQQKPSSLMAAVISYPQFVEVLAALTSHSKAHPSNGLVPGAHFEFAQTWRDMCWSLEVQHTDTTMNDRDLETQNDGRTKPGLA
eukprot:gene2043-18220_t